MFIFINAFLSGTASGLRALIGLAAVSWAVHIGILPLVTGALCGLAIGLSGNGMIIGLVAGIIGAVAGTFGGAKARNLLARTFGRDLPAALLEDAVALGIAAFALFR